MDSVLLLMLYIRVSLQGVSVMKLLSIPVFLSLFSVGIGIALFTVGNAPTGLPIPVLSVGFLAAGILFWFGADLERQAAYPKPAP